MFNDLKKVKELIQKNKIPKKLDAFVEKLDNIEIEGIEKIEEYLNEAEKLEDFIMKYKGKVAVRSSLDYCHIMVQLRHNLIELHEDKQKEVMTDEDKKMLEEDYSNIRRICDSYKRARKNKNKPKKKKSLFKKMKRNFKNLSHSIKFNAKRIAKNIKIDIIESCKIISKSASRTKRRMLRSSNKNKEKNQFVIKTLKPALIALAILCGMGGAAKIATEKTQKVTTTKNYEAQLDDHGDLPLAENLESEISSIIEGNGLTASLENNNINSNYVSMNDIGTTENTSEVEEIKSEIEEINPEIEDMEVVTESVEEVITDIEETTPEVEGVIENQEETTEIEIGNSVSIAEGSNSYGNMYDAYFNENKLNPKYADKELKREIKTVIVSNGDTLKNIKSNDQLEEYIQNGYEIVGCGITNEYSQDGTIEGYYRIESINQKQLQKTL